jgi:hypothetical protein
MYLDWEGWEVKWVCRGCAVGVPIDWGRTRVSRAFQMVYWLFGFVSHS